MSAAGGSRHPGPEVRAARADPFVRQVLIVPAGVADSGEILTVQRAAYLTEAQHYDDPFLPPLTETLDEVVAALAGPTIVLVARLGHRLVGSVRAHLDGGTAHIGRLSV